jgi:hypothetical protein
MMTHGNEMSADAYEPYDFANRRHIGPSPEEIAEMLRVVGVSSLEALIDETEGSAASRQVRSAGKPVRGGRGRRPRASRSFGPCRIGSACGNLPCGRQGA